MGHIRPLTREDIPVLVTLRRQSFELSNRPDPKQLADYFDRIFFRSPWVDREMPSLVYEDEDGQICGFQGVVPRPLLFRGERIRAATATQLMVAPEHRNRGIATQLLQHLFGGAQDLTLTDASGDRVSMLWQSVGASVVTVFSTFWLKPLQPVRHAVTEWSRGRFMGRAVRATRPLLSLVDAIWTRRPNSPFHHLPPGTRAQELDVRTLAEQMPGMTGRYALRPEYDERSFSWLLHQLTEKRNLGTLRQRVVLGANGDLAGWYIGFVMPGGFAQVVQLVAQDGQEPTVAAHLFHDAWRRGAVALTGRLDPAFAGTLAGSDCHFRREAPWMLVHSRRAELVQAIHDGDALLTRLDGEWWLTF